MTRDERLARIAEIERRNYGRLFLDKSLHGDACEWRRLTAPNAPSFDASHERQRNGAK